MTGHIIHCLQVCIYIYVVPIPTVSLTDPGTLMLGESPTLQCEVTAVRGITSRVDIVWRSGGTELQRMNNASSTMMNNSLVYTNSYTITQLNTSDDGRVIQCEIVINTSPSVRTNDRTTLEVNCKSILYVAIQFIMVLGYCVH